MVDMSDATTQPVGNDRSRSPWAVGLAAALVVALVVDVVALLGHLPWLRVVAKPLLMPVLAGWVLVVATRPVARPVRRLLVGLGLAWLGDVALLCDADVAFLVGLLCFLGMQVAYLAAFPAVPGRGLVQLRPALALPYLVVWVAMNGWLHPGVDTLFVPVLVYSAVLLAMAVRALDVSAGLPRPFGAWVAVGGALFVVSDGLLAAAAFDAVAGGAGWDSAVMTTYVAAQALIAAGLTLGCGGWSGRAGPLAAATVRRRPRRPT